MAERELPYECDVCGEEEDRMGIDHATVIVGTCHECGAVCCGACLPAGVGTRCGSCGYEDDGCYEIEPSPDGLAKPTERSGS